MLTRENSLEKIITYVRDNYVVDASVVIPLDRSLHEEGILDSFAVVELITYLEKEFKIKIPDEDITKEKLGSIYKMTDYVLGHGGRQ